MMTSLIMIETIENYLMEMNCVDESKLTLRIIKTNLFNIWQNQFSNQEKIHCFFY